MKKSMDGFVRDPRNPGAAINTDNAALQAYKLQKNKNREVEQLKGEVAEIRSKLDLIIELLKKD